MTDQYLVVGNPINHSKSPWIHRQFAQQCDQDMQYQARCLEPETFESDLDRFFDQGGCGMNVTVPFKTQAFDYATLLDPLAARAGAVNTLAREVDSQGNHLVRGYNTDGLGLVADLTRLGFNFKDRRILILGAGGAVRGVLEPILNQGPARLDILNRTHSKAEALIQLFTDSDVAMSAVRMSEQPADYDLIINGTSASLSGQAIELPGSLVHPDSWCYDMMYSSTKTVFQLWAAEQGVSQNHDGLGMLVEQAAEAFYLWRGERPDTVTVIRHLRQELADNS